MKQDDAGRGKKSVGKKAPVRRALERSAFARTRHDGCVTGENLSTCRPVLKPTPGFDLGEALRSQLEASAAAFEGLRPVDAVHRGRTSLKRARALARLGKAAAPELSRQIIAGIRSIMRRFSDARDLDAIATCAKFYADQEQGRTRRAFSLLARKISGQRDALETPSLAEAAREVRALVAAAQGWPALVEEASLAYGARRLGRRARKAYRAAQRSGHLEDRHVWRQREKERLYATLLLGDAWPKKLPRRRRRAQRLGELLGLERDTLMLSDRIRAEPALAGAPDDADRLLAFLAGRLDKLRRRADKFGKRLHKD